MNINEELVQISLYVGCITFLIIMIFDVEDLPPWFSLTVFVLAILSAVYLMFESVTSLIGNL